MEDKMDKLPTALDAEKALIGSLILDNTHIGEVANMLSREDFFDVRHKSIFDVLLKCYLASKPMDLALMSSELEGNIEDEYLLGLCEAVGATSSALYYAEKVRDVSRRRNIIMIASEVSTALRSESLESEAISDCGLKLMRVIENSIAGESSKLISFQELLSGIDFDREAKKVEIASGITKLDDNINLFLEGKLSIIAGRPSCGKSSFMRQLVLVCASKRPCLVFSLEDSPETFRDKLISTSARVQYRKMSNPKFLSDTERHRLVESSGALWNTSKIFVYNGYLLTPYKVKLLIKNFTLSNPQVKPIIFIDYLGLMEHPKGEKLVDRIGATTRILKLMSLELQLPVILVSQLKRFGEGRESLRPVLSDLRDSGNIEQDADNVVFLWAEDIGLNKRTLTIAKHRDGALFEFDLTFLGEFARFENYRKEELRNE